MDSLQLLLMVFAASLSPASAAPDAAYARASRPPAEVTAAASTARLGFDARTRSLIEDYYRGNAPNLPSALAKTGELPPRHDKRIERNGHLPPGIDQQSLPPELARRLPPLPHGYDRVIVGGDVVLIEVSTRTVVDVLHGVLG